jgi:hypothetical protein
MQLANQVPTDSIKRTSFARFRMNYLFTVNSQRYFLLSFLYQREKNFQRSSVVQITDRRQDEQKKKKKRVGQEEQKFEARKRKEIDSLNKREEVSCPPFSLLSDNHSTGIRRRIRRTITVKESQQLSQEDLQQRSKDFCHSFRIFSTNHGGIYLIGT